MTYFIPVFTGHVQAKGDVFKDAHVGKKGVILKDRIHSPFFWGDTINRLAIKQQSATGTGLKSTY